MRTRICDQLGIELPVCSAGMGLVARAELAAAVSNAGGLGVLGGAGMSADELRAEIRKVRELTGKPFGVDLLLPVQWTQGGDGQVSEQMRVVLEEAPAVFASGLGDPGPWVGDLHGRGIVVMALVGTVRNAIRVAGSGVDVVVAQGTEAGGHTGRVATMALVPAVVDAVSPVPVIAAGGITDGRGLAAALCLGASGVWMGTRFVATREAASHENYKLKIVEADEDSTVITRSYSGKPLRVIRNAWTEEWESRQQDILPFPQQFRHSGRIYGAARLHGDTDVGSMPCGQGARLITDLPSAADVLRAVVSEADRVLLEDVPHR